MIERYTLPEMGQIWTDENRFNTWLEVEKAACTVRYELGEIPELEYNEIISKATFNTERVLEIENTTQHDVIAFLTNVAEYVGPASRFIHYGMTSSDVLDTALSLQMIQAGNILMTKLVNFSSILKKRAIENKYTYCIGRTHGIHAELTTMGLKFLLWYEETKRNIVRLQSAIETISVGKLSGAVGTFEHLNPNVEELVCHKLSLKPATVATQVIQRDRHAEYLTTLAIIGATLEKIAIEIRHLQKTEVLEAEEYFSKGQKGSSAMPHKRNPITCERITGLARLLRSNSMAALENVALWHERDISHSSVERVIIPDSTITLDYMLKKSIDLIENLILYPENMTKNINLTRGLVFSQKVLLQLTKKGMLREEAYKIVQESAMKVWRDTSLSLKSEFLNDNRITSLITNDELNELFSVDNALKNIDAIFNRSI